MADLLQRVFAIDVLVCTHCDALREPSALRTKRFVVREILDHLELRSEPPNFASARLSAELAFDA